MTLVIRNELTFMRSVCSSFIFCYIFSIDQLFCCEACATVRLTLVY